MKCPPTYMQSHAQIASLLRGKAHSGEPCQGSVLTNTAVRRCVLCWNYFCSAFRFNHRAGRHTQTPCSKCSVCENLHFHWCIVHVVHQHTTIMLPVTYLCSPTLPLCSFLPHSDWHIHLHFFGPYHTYMCRQAAAYSSAETHMRAWEILASHVDALQAGQSRVCVRGGGGCWCGCAWICQPKSCFRSGVRVIRVL